MYPVAKPTLILLRLLFKAPAIRRFVVNIAQVLVDNLRHTYKTLGIENEIKYDAEKGQFHVKWLRPFNQKQVDEYFIAGLLGGVLGPVLNTVTGAAKAGKEVVKTAAETVKEVKAFGKKELGQVVSGFAEVAEPMTREIREVRGIATELASELKKAKLTIDDLAQEVRRGMSGFGIRESNAPNNPPRIPTSRW